MDSPVFIVQGQSSFMSPMYGNSMRMGMYGMASPMPYGGIQAPAADIGKGKAREADFEAAFAKVLESLSLEDSKPAQTSRIEEVDEAGNAVRFSTLSCISWSYHAANF